MNAAYAFEIDRAKELVRITLSGFFTKDDIQSFLADRTRAHAELGCAPNMHLTCTDIRDMKIQAQEMVASFHEMLAAPEFRSRRLAFVVGPTLARTQLVRAIGERNARCFFDRETAEAWLLEGDEAAA
jgi:hypothetical protein